MPVNRRYFTLTAVSLLFATACIGGVVTMGMTGKRLWDFPVFGHSDIAQPLTNPLAPEEVQRIAQSITVKVLSNKTSGSGILVSKKGANGKKEDIYSVLTNRHVLMPGEPYRIQTPDGQIHQANVVKDVNFKGSDLALLEFSSAKDYTLAELMSVSTLAVNQQVFAAGFVPDAEKLVFTNGEISLLPDQAFQDGYKIGYTNNVQKGMSGGPILNQRGEVIGINGIIANPIWGNPYVFEDGSKPNDTEREKMSRFSWGIAIKTAVELAPELVETNRVKELDRIAEEITVRIDFPNGNGSGVIIAKQDGFFTKNYYILTAYHVVDEAVKYQVVTPDGRRHSVDYSTVKPLPGVDLAVLQFTSNQSYRVASLASEDIKDYHNVFVSGWPTSKVSKGKPIRLFSFGKTLKQDSQDSILVLDLSDGYELVYTNITAGGVSGGPVLNTFGSVMGIHGRADGEETIDQAGEIQRIHLGYSFGISIRRFFSLVSKVGIKPGWFNRESPIPRKENQRDVVKAGIYDIIHNYAITNIEPRFNPNNPIDLLNLSNRMWRLGAYQEALDSLNLAIQIQPKLYQAWYLRGILLLRQDKQEALNSFYRSTIIEPKFTPSWRWRGIILEYFNRLEEALISIDTALNLEPNSSFLHLYKGGILNELNRYEGALTAYSRSIQLQPNAYAYYDRGRLRYTQMKDKQGALSDHTKAIELKPEYAEAYANRGIVRSELGDKEGALSDYTKAIEFKPDYADVYAIRGSYYFDTGNTREAIIDYTKAINQNSEFTEVYCDRAKAYSKLGERQKAIKDLEKAAQLFREQGDMAKYQSALDLLREVQK
jgi:tetratricopeptide (TPR) repeat protein/S1-C subfamily serine protease